MFNATQGAQAVLAFNAGKFNWQHSGPLQGFCILADENWQNDPDGAWVWVYKHGSNALALIDFDTVDGRWEELYVFDLATGNEVGDDSMPYRDYTIWLEHC